MILHHYEMSPFSEKVRAMLGYAKLSWSSAISPAMPPRPLVDPLSGGYRRIPIAQIGADVFCDTQIICAEIADLANDPSLAFGSNAEIDSFVEHIEGDVFMAVVNSASPLKALGLIVKNFNPLQGLRFIKDRAQIAKSMTRQRVSGSYASSLLDEQTTDLEFRLQQSKFLFGDTPCVADFSAYHVFWFRGVMQGERYLANAPKLKQWLANMSQFPSLERAAISAEEVFDVAKSNAPRKIAANMRQHELIGHAVTIRPNDYAQVPVAGTLVAASEQRFVLARQTESFGTLHVHFPQLGYELAKQ